MKDDIRDEQIDCVGCGQRFVWTVGEQQFFKEKGFVERPKRCRSCREQRRQARQTPPSGSEP